jgi:hypothetical protein
VQQQRDLAINPGVLRVAGQECDPPIGEELPMELTQAATAVMAIVSFSFVAAIILGML